MWCIYIIHQLNKGLDLNTAIHQELFGTGDDLYQNNRDIRMWFSYNYARVILSQNGMRRIAPPDFLLKHRILLALVCGVFCEFVTFPLDLLCFCSVMCLLCFVRVCLYVLCGHLLGKG